MTLREQAFAEIAATTSLAELEAVRLRWLGRKGIITLLLRTLYA